MRLLSVLSLIAAVSLACAGAPCGDGTVERDGECVADLPEGDDTGDGSADTDPLVADAYYQDLGATVEWTIEVDGAASEAEIWMIETGDPSFDGECRKSDIGDGGLACGAWSEHHTAFEVSGEAGGITTLRLVLDATDELSQQETDVATLFQDPFLDNVTFLVEIDGGVDCAVGGESPDALSADCDNAL